MQLLNKLKAFFQKVGEKATMAITGRELTKITDHPKIGIDSNEYKRIDQNIDYYANLYPDIQYLNSYGNQKKRPFNSLNVTKTAARRLASIIFNEKCQIALNKIDENEETEGPILEGENDFLEDLLVANNFYNLFEINLEKGIALGGFAMRPYVDAEGKIKIAWIRADQFYPLQSNTNEVTECAIATKKQVTEGNTLYYYTLLEFHEWQGSDYLITNELYQSTEKNRVGRQVPLTDVYENLAETVTLKGLKRPLFTYFRTPGANNKSLESPLGVGIVDNSKEVLDQINTTHDQFACEIQMGQRRVIVPAEWLRVSDKDTAHPAMFDSDQNVLMGVYGDQSNFGGIKDVTVAIRTIQYKDAIDHWLKEFEVQIGLSVGALSYANDGLQTATEVVSNNSMTYQTRSSYLTMVEKSINELVHTIFELASYKELFPNNQALYITDDEAFKVEVTFDDGVFVNQDKQLENDLKVAVAGMMPKKEFMKRNLGISDEEADKWLMEIQEERESAMVETPEKETEGAYLSKGD